MYRIGIIRVITQNQEATDAHGRLVERWFPEFETVSRCIPDQPEGIRDAETKALAVPKVVALAREMEQNGLDGIMISCADDPGVAEVRAQASIPVVGAGECTASAATRFGEKIAVLGITQAVPESYRRILKDRLFTDVVPDGVRNTLDLRTEAGMAATVAAAQALAADGADAVALACTGLATIGIAPVLEQETGIPVLDPVLCAAHALLFDLLRADGNRSMTT